MLSLIALARLGGHAAPAAECHTYILGVRGVEAASVACGAATRVPLRITGKRGRWSASGHCHPNHYQLSQTIANYRSCLRLHWRPRGSARRAISRICLLGMQQYVCRRHAPRGSTLVMSLSHWHAMEGTPHRWQNVARKSWASGVSGPPLWRFGQPRGCPRVAQASGGGGLPRGTAIPTITNYCKISQTIAAVCGFTGAPGALHAAPWRGIVSWGCSNTIAAVMRRAGAR